MQFWFHFPLRLTWLSCSWLGNSTLLITLLIKASLSWPPPPLYSFLPPQPVIQVHLTYVMGLPSANSLLRYIHVQSHLFLVHLYLFSYTHFGTKEGVSNLLNIHWFTGITRSFLGKVEGSMMALFVKCLPKTTPFARMTVEEHAFSKCAPKVSVKHL